MALDDAAAGGDQPGRIEPEPGQRTGRLPHDEGGVRSDARATYRSRSIGCT